MYFITNKSRLAFILDGFSAEGVKLTDIPAIIHSRRFLPPQMRHTEDKSIYSFQLFHPVLCHTCIRGIRWIPPAFDYHHILLCGAQGSCGGLIKASLLRKHSCPILHLILSWHEDLARPRGAGIPLPWTYPSWLIGWSSERGKRCLSFSTAKRDDKMKSVFFSRQLWAKWQFSPSHEFSLTDLAEYKEVEHCRRKQHTPLFVWACEHHKCKSNCYPLVM